MASGNRQVRETRQFAIEDRGQTWRLLAETFLALGMLIVGVALSPWISAKVVLGIAAGLVELRLFIFYHDYLHTAILADSHLGGLLMRAAGVFMLTAPSVWRETHDYHHRNNAKLIGSAIGSFPVVSIALWRKMSGSERRWYRLVRSPLNVGFGYFTVFIYGMCLSAFQRDCERHWVAPVSVALHVLGVGVVAWTLGPATALCAVVLPLVVALGLGSYLFYAQHNFPSVKLQNRGEWEFFHAATRSSSYFEMGPVMRWCSGSIGFHHVHHLNHRIPFYRLEAAMESLPGLQRPGRTSWRWRDIAACFRLAAWDPDRNRMLTYDELDLLENGGQ